MDSQRSADKPVLETTTDHDIHEQVDAPADVEIKSQNTHTTSTLAIENNGQTDSNYITGAKFWLIIISFVNRTKRPLDTG